jgi:hypothetical protein
MKPVVIINTNCKIYKFRFATIKYEELENKKAREKKTIDWEESGLEKFDESVCGLMIILWILKRVRLPH